MRPGKIQSAEYRVVERRSEVAGELMLDDDAQATGIQIRARVAEGAGRNIGRPESTGSGDFSCADQGRIRDAIGISGDKKPGLAHPL